MNLQAYVITILSNEHSVASATRTIESGKKHGVEVQTYNANTPENTNLDEYFAENNIPPVHFVEKFSRLENCMAAFSSHHSLWKKCAEGKDAFLILEHDAYFVDSLPKTLFGHVVNLGKPSYGNYRTPMLIGENPLTSKAYLGGAHAYMVTPFGASLLLNRAQVDAGPTDLFIHTDRFPGLIKEYFPWPVEARDTFTTIQTEVGCVAKHNYNEQYQII
jgi:GR25 family glycosyltransferase involved in LPS biosynthesis